MKDEREVMKVNWGERRRSFWSSSSLHSEACNALGASDGVIHSSISLEVVSLRATTNNQQQSNI